MKNIRRFSEVILDLAQGYLLFSKEREIVTFLGGARFSSDHPYCKLSYELAMCCAKRGKTVMTGGGRGVMSAANQGAYEAGGRSIGATIAIFSEQIPNPYMHKQMQFHHMFTRKLFLIRYAKAFIVFPGGFGTLDELFEILTLMQIEIKRKRPVYLVGSEYWGPLYSWIENALLEEGAISPEDHKLLQIIDSCLQLESLLSCKEAE